MTARKGMLIGQCRVCGLDGPGGALTAVVADGVVHGERSRDGARGLIRGTSHSIGANFQGFKESLRSLLYHGWTLERKSENIRVVFLQNNCEGTYKLYLLVRWSRLIYLDYV